MAKKKNNLTLEEKLKNALVSEEEQPYPIPDNWVWTRLGEVCKFERGITFPSSAKKTALEENLIPCVRTANVQEKLTLGDLIYIDKSYMKNNELKYLKENDIIMSSANSRELVGKTCFVEQIPFPMTFGGFVLTIRAKKIYSKFLFYMLRLEFLSGNFIKESTQTTNIANINTTSLSKYKFPLPPFQEQQRIVERIESLFSKLDEAKEKIQLSLDNFENRKSAILYQAFSGELTKKWREENGVKFKDWDKVELRERCHINPKKISTKELNDNMDITFIPMASVSDILGEVSEPLVKKLGKYKKGYTNFSEGDILFAKITPCMENGKIAVVKELENNIGFGSTEFHIVRCNNTYNRFIYHLLRWKKFREEAKVVMSGAVGQQRVPKSFLEEYKISFPSLEEQKEIVHIMDTIFDKEQDIQELIDLIENIDLMKKSILARAFRGELGTNIPEEESAIELLKSVLEV